MKRVLVLLPVLLLLLGIGGAVAAWKLGYLMVGTPTALAADYAEHGPARWSAAASRRRAPGPGEGIMYATKERVVNLADQGGNRYLKASVVIELAREDGSPAPTNVEHYKKAQEALASDLVPLSPAIEDLITTVLTSKTSTELISAEGKAALKSELQSRLNELFHDDRVIAVYFTEFIIQ